MSTGVGEPPVRIEILRISVVVLTHGVGNAAPRFFRTFGCSECRTGAQAPYCFAITVMASSLDVIVTSGSPSFFKGSLHENVMRYSPGAVI